MYHRSIIYDYFKIRQHLDLAYLCQSKSYWHYVKEKNLWVGMIFVIKIQVNQRKQLGQNEDSFTF